MANKIDIRTEAGSLDLYKGAERDFYITRQVNDLNNFQNRNADYTKSLSIPPTPNNRALLNSFSSGISEEEQGIQCTITIDGITIAHSAILYHTSSTITNDQFDLEIVLFYGNFNFFQRS